MDWKIILELIKPELLILVIFCWIVGLLLKNTEKFNDKTIPSILWGISVLFSFLYLQFMIPGDYTIPQKVIAGIVQGTLIVGISVFGHQQIKQLFSKD